MRIVGEIVQVSSTVPRPARAHIRSDASAHCRDPSPPYGSQTLLPPRCLLCREWPRASHLSFLLLGCSKRKRRRVGFGTGFFTRCDSLEITRPVGAVVPPSFGCWRRFRGVDGPWLVSPFSSSGAPGDCGLGLLCTSRLLCEHKPLLLWDKQPEVQLPGRVVIVPYV